MSLFERIGELPLEVESYAFEAHELLSVSHFQRLTTVIRLEGGGREGRGEDTSYSSRNQESLRAAGPVLNLAGSFNLRSFSAHLDGLDLWPEPADNGMYVNYRRWAYESAALELALAQAGLSLASALGREQGRARFVVSTSLGTPPSTARLHELLEFEPRLRFKLDTSNHWTKELIAELAALDRVDVVDFKGAYSGTTVDQTPDPALYRRVLAGFRAAWLEDPHRIAPIYDLLERDWERVTWDAPIHGVADVLELPRSPHMLNIKPSRCGTLKGYFDLIDYCESNGISMYGGGQYELADGRRLIQELAGIFHPDAPNDIAPVQFNRVELKHPLDDELLSYPVV